MIFKKVYSEEFLFNKYAIELLKGSNGPVGGNGVHNNINTRAELRNYDPTLFQILSEVFPCGNFPIDRCSSSQVCLKKFGF